MSSTLNVPSSLTNALVERLARLSGQRAGVAEVALSAIGYGSRASLIAHEIIEDVPTEGDEPAEIRITEKGWRIIDACANARPLASASVTPRLARRLAALDGQPDEVVEVSLSALAHNDLAALAAYKIIGPVSVGSDEPQEITLTDRGREFIAACARVVASEGNGNEAADGLFPAMERALLLQDASETPMELGAVARFEGPPPPLEHVLDHVRSRLHLVPRYRQKLARPLPRRLSAPLQSLAPPRWVDDPNFRLEYHIRNVALPRPTDRGLAQQIGRIFSQPLDRSKPLWELWLIEGLDDDGFALVSKAHYALLEDLSGVDLLTILYDLLPEPVTAVGEEPWAPEPEPSAVELVALSAGDVMRTAVALPFRLAGSAVKPRRAAGAVFDTLEGFSELAWLTAKRGRGTSPLNVPVGPHRLIVAANASFSDLRTIKEQLGGSLNDVVITAAAGGVRHWLQSRGALTDELSLRALAVSVRGPRDEGPLMSRLRDRVIALPVLEDDPIARHARIREATASTGGPSDLPGVHRRPTPFGQLARLLSASGSAALTIASIPGSSFPLFFMGRRMVALCPLPFLTSKQPLAIAAMSYDGRMHFGLVADREALPDLELIGDGIEASVDELLRAIRLARPSRRPRRSRAKATSPTVNA